jgi:hypothetical protein
MTLQWCELCQSRHTKEFGDNYHERVIDPHIREGAFQRLYPFKIDNRESSLDPLIESPVKTIVFAH